MFACAPQTTVRVSAVMKTMVVFSRLLENYEIFRKSGKDETFVKLEVAGSDLLRLFSECEF